MAIVTFRHVKFHLQSSIDLHTMSFVSFLVVMKNRACCISSAVAGGGLECTNAGSYDGTTIQLLFFGETLPFASPLMLQIACYMSHSIANVRLS